MFGGAVKGGQVKGTYPDELSPEGSQILGRGRIIPTTPWDAPFKGIASWLGVEEVDLPKVCVNCQNFPSSSLFSADDLFDGVSSATSNYNNNSGRRNLRSGRIHSENED